jgi:hypothetical protein
VVLRAELVTQVVRHPSKGGGSAVETFVVAAIRILVVFGS